MVALFEQNRRPPLDVLKRSYLDFIKGVSSMTIRLTPEGMDQLRDVIAGLDALQAEVAAAVKRKAGEPVSAFQLKLVNGVLAKANTILGSKRPVDDFDKFELDDVPIASDVSMVVSLYVEAIESIRCEHIQRFHDEHGHGKMPQQSRLFLREAANDTRKKVSYFISAG